MLQARFAVSYARTACADLECIREQHEQNAMHAAMMGFVIPDDRAFRFDDCGISGFMEEKPGLGSLLRQIVDGPQFSYLFVTRLSRLARCPRRGAEILSFCQDHGLEIFSAPGRFQKVPPGYVDLLFALAEARDGRLP